MTPPVLPAGAAYATDFDELDTRAVFSPDRPPARRPSKRPAAKPFRAQSCPIRPRNPPASSCWTRPACRTGKRASWPPRCSSPRPKPRRGRSSRLRTATQPARGCAHGRQQRTDPNAALDYVRHAVADGDLDGLARRFSRLTVGCPAAVLTSDMDHCRDTRRGSQSSVSGIVCGTAQPNRRGRR